MKNSIRSKFDIMLQLVALHLNEGKSYSSGFTSGFLVENVKASRSVDLELQCDVTDLSVVHELLTAVSFFVGAAVGFLVGA